MAMLEQSLHLRLWSTVTGRLLILCFGTPTCTTGYIPYTSIYNGYIRMSKVVQKGKQYSKQAEPEPEEEPAAEAEEPQEPEFAPLSAEYVCGRVRLQLAPLVRGLTTLHFEQTIQPYTTVQATDGLDWRQRPGVYMHAQSQLEASIRFEDLCVLLYCNNPVLHLMPPVEVVGVATRSNGACWWGVEVGTSTRAVSAGAPRHYQDSVRTGQSPFQEHFSSWIIQIQ